MLRYHTLAPALVPVPPSRASIRVKQQAKVTVRQVLTLEIKMHKQAQKTAGYFHGKACRTEQERRHPGHGQPHGEPFQTPVRPGFQYQDGIMLHGVLCRSIHETGDFPVPLFVESRPRSGHPPVPANSPVENRRPPATPAGLLQENIRAGYRVLSCRGGRASSVFAFYARPAYQQRPINPLSGTTTFSWFPRSPGPDSGLWDRQPCS